MLNVSVLLWFHIFLSPLFVVISHLFCCDFTTFHHFFSRCHHFICCDFTTFGCDFITFPTFILIQFHCFLWNHFTTFQNLSRILEIDNLGSQGEMTRNTKSLQDSHRFQESLRLIRMINKIRWNPFHHFVVISPLSKSCKCTTFTPFKNCGFTTLGKMWFHNFCIGFHMDPRNWKVVIKIVILHKFSHVVNSDMYV